MLIPQGLYQDPNIDPVAKLLFGIIRQQVKHAPTCILSDAALGKKIGVSRWKVMRCARQLEQAGYLRTVTRDGRRSQRVLLWHPKLAHTLNPDLFTGAQVECTGAQAPVHGCTPHNKVLGVSLGVSGVEERAPEARAARSGLVPGVDISPGDWEVDQYIRKARAANVPAAAIARHAERMRAQYAQTERKRLAEAERVKARVLAAIPR